MSALYSCACVGEFLRPGRPDVVECSTCGAQMIGKVPISRELRKALREATWMASEPEAIRLADFIESSTGCTAQVVKEGSPLGRALATSLGAQRDWNVTHRNGGFLVNRPGFSSSDFKTRARLRKALQRSLLSSRQPRVIFEPDETNPAVLGKLLESEFAHRVGRRVAAAILNPVKRPLSATHPVLQLAYHVSADGTAGLRLPLEFKSVNSLGDVFRQDALHQLALQAIAFGVDEGVLLRAERRFSGDGRYAALRVANLRDFHSAIAQRWLGDDDLVGLIDAVRGRC